MDKSNVKEIIGKYGVLPVINITEKAVRLPILWPPADFLSSR